MKTQMPNPRSAASPVAAYRLRFMALCFIFFPVLCSASGVEAKSAMELVSAGNKLFLQGKYDLALQKYQSAEAGNAAAEINFNEGDVYFKTGHYKTAEKHYEMAALSARDFALKSKCHFNLGSLYFRRAEGARPKDPSKAAVLYNRSARHYLEAYRLDPALKQAGEDLERVRAILEALRHKGPEIEPSHNAWERRPNGQKRQPAPRARAEGKQGPGSRQSMPGARKTPGQQTANFARWQAKKSPATGPEVAKDMPPDMETPSMIFHEEMENRARTARFSHLSTRPVERDW